MAGLHSFTVGGVLGRGFAILDRHGARLAAAAALLVALPTLLSSLAGTVGRAAYESDGALGGSVHVSSSHGEGLLVFLAQILFNAFVIATAFADMRGEAPDAGAALRAALRAYLPMLGIALLATLGIGFGCLLFVVPGLVLMCAWSVAGPAYMAERPGVLAAFGRSWRITAGHRWPIFGLGLVYILAVALSFGLGTGAILLGLGATGTTGALLTLASAAFSAAVATGSAVGTTAIYIELRRVEDVPPPD